MQIKDSHLLIIDDEPVNVKLLERLLLQEGYKNVTGILDAKEGIAHFSAQPCDLVLLDINMPEMDGFAVLAELKRLTTPESFPPVLILTAQADRQTKLRALEGGALDFIAKPFDLVELSNRIRNMLQLRALHNQVRDQNRILEDKVRERTLELEETRLEIIQRLGRAAEYRDNETGMHIIRMSRMSGCLARALGWDAARVNLLIAASPMHDVGKIGIPDRILLKPGRLEADEWEIMKTHAMIGSEILSGHSSELLQMAQRIALSHHEKWDGSGYPYGLAGEQIPLDGRIVAVADVFDALTSKRPYKEAWSLEATLGYMQEQKGKHFQPMLIDLLLQNMEEVLAIKKAYSDAKHSELSGLHVHSA